MAITSSAKKAHKQSLKKRVYNVRRMRAMRAAVKELLGLVRDNKRAEAEKLMPTVYKTIDKATKRGVIKKNSASRTKSRLSGKVASLK